MPAIVIGTIKRRANMYTAIIIQAVVAMWSEGMAEMPLPGPKPLLE